MAKPHADAVRLTADSPGAIGVILLAGSGAAHVLRGLAPSLRTERVEVGAFAKTILRSGDGTALDDALVVHTGEDRWELHVHGGTAVVEGVLEELRLAGTRIIPSAEAGHLLGSGIAGEVQLALPRAATETALRLLLAQPSAWKTWASHWLHWLARQPAGAPLWELYSAAQWLLQRSAALCRVFEPARIAIVGAPNVGKSSLANSLLGRPVSITSANAGTTRDWVDAQAIFVAQPPVGAYGKPVHVPVFLVDTAGLRETPDALERASIARTHRQAAEADLIILLFDATRLPTSDELALLDAYADRGLILVANKMDAVSGPLSAAYSDLRPLPISAKTHQGLDALMTAALAQLDLLAIGEECFAFSSRRGELLWELALCNDAAACASVLEQLA
jgi:tRNA modification GTPase